MVFDYWSIILSLKPTQPLQLILLLCSKFDKISVCQRPDSRKNSLSAGVVC